MHLIIKRVRTLDYKSRFIIIPLGFYFLLSPYHAFAEGNTSSLSQAEQHYLKGKEYYSQQRYEKADQEFEKGLQLLRSRKAAAIEQDKKDDWAQADISEISEGIQQVDNLKVSQDREYYLDIDDVLDISVWQVPELSHSEVIVRPDGKISFPLIGDIIAEGLTLTQLDNIITEKLKTFVKSPEVTVMIRRFGERVKSHKVVVLGEVFIPGVYKFESLPTITEVIASAGGYTKYAVLNSVMVIRRDSRKKPDVKRLNVAQVLKQGNLSQNIILKANDIIYVPRSFIGKVNVFLELIQPAIDEYFQTMNARTLHDTMHRKSGT